MQLSDSASIAAVRPHARPVTSTAQLRRLRRRLNPTGEHASPVTFAEARSRGQWRRAAHLELIEAAVLDTIRTGGRLIISVSVRHGKSELVSRWLPAWYLGTHPDNRVILAGHEADFASRHGRFARDVLTEHGPDVFGVEVSRDSTAAGRWDIARPNHGGMLTLGVGGSPIGRGADLLIVDDPIKNYADAMSPLVRQRIQEWWTGTMVSRIEPGGAAIVICARWHDDDLSGFLLRTDPDNWREIRLPAIADSPDDPLGRQPGEPLWPDRYPLTELERRRRETSLALGEQVWLAQYQQTPRRPEGGMFPADRWVIVDAAPFDPRDVRWVRGWDLAATEDGGDFTASVRMGVMPDGRVVIDDVTRAQWSADQVRRNLLDTARRDGHGCTIKLPQDPGQAGKDQAQQLVRLLTGWPAYAEPQSGSKEVRATGLSAQQRARNVVLVDGPWLGPFVAELEAFPRGTHDDQVDAAATAFNELAGPPIDIDEIIDDTDQVSISPY